MMVCVGQSRLYCVSLILVIFQSIRAQRIDLNKCCPRTFYYDVERNNCRRYEKAAEIPKKSWTVPRILYFEDYMQPLKFKLMYNATPSCLSGNGELTSYEISAVNRSDSLYMTNMGILMELGTSSPELFINHERNDYCVDFRQDKIIFRVCPARCNGENGCVRKCCPLGQHFDYSHQHMEPHCVTSPITRSERSADHGYLSSSFRNWSSKSQPRFISGHDDVIYNCDLEAITVSTGWSFAKSNVPFKVGANGTPSYLRADGKGWRAYKNPGDFCYENVLQYPDGSLECAGETLVLYMCPTADSEATPKPTQITSLSWDRKVHMVTLPIAIMSLLITALVLGLLIEKSSMNSWTRLAYILSHLLFIFLSGIPYWDGLNSYDRPIGCKAFAIIFHFCGLTTICWLSVINFDIWWTFKQLRPAGDRQLNTSLFLKYCLFAVGIPASIILIALAVQSGKPKHVCLSALTERSTNFLYTDYGNKDNKRCTMSNASFPLYWYGPLSFLLFANLVFFISTSCRLTRLYRLTKRVVEVSSNNNNHGGSKQAYLFIKIFLVSGITWNAEIISWLSSDSTSVWIDIIHHFQAFALFVIFICKADILWNLQSKYPMLTKIFPNQGASVQTTSMVPPSCEGSDSTKTARSPSVQ